MTELWLEEGNYGPQFADIFHMGPGNYSWFVNENDLLFDNSSYTVTELPLIKGTNYVYFLAYGLKADDQSIDKYKDFLYWNPYPNLKIASSVFKVVVGEEPTETTITSTVTTSTDTTVTTTDTETTTETGPLFTIFISVSMVGLAVAMILRRRKYNR